MFCKHCEALELRVAELEAAVVDMAADHEDMVEEVAELAFDFESFLDDLVVEEDEEV